MSLDRLGGVLLLMPTGSEKNKEDLASENATGREDRRRRQGLVSMTMLALLIGFATGAGEQLAELLAKVLGA